MASHGYGTINNRVAIANSHMRKEERQPLLLNSEPLNDSYDKRTLPRPDVRASPDNVLNLTGGSLDSSLVVDTKLDGKSEMGSSGGNPYDPILDRNLQHPTSNLDTMIHLLKGNIGTGILAMPDAFRNSGLVIGTLGTLLMGAICTHCMHILVRCSHELCRKRNVPSLGFSEVVESSFITGPSFIQKHSKPAKILVNVFLCITQLGFCCVYFVFVAVNIKDVLSHYGNYNFHTYQYLLMLLVPMILLNWVKNLKFLTPVSLFAAVVTVVGLGITFFYMLQGLPRTSTVRKFAPWKQLPLFFGTVIYAFEGIGVVLPLENNMKNPQDFGGWTGVLNTGMAIVAVLYTSVGFFGYLKYGEKAKLGSITLNLPQNDLLAQSVRLMMAVAIFLSYGLQFYVPMGIIWPIVEQHLVSERSKVVGEYVLRTILVTFTLCLAVAIPNLGAVISLVGAISSSTLALIFPPLIEIITFSDDLGPYKWVLWKDIVIMCFGLCGFGFGTYASIGNILAPQD